MSETYNILVIENDTRTLDLLSETLEKSGFSVFTATHADVGLSQAKKIDPVVILLNLATPGTKGLEICKTFQKEESLKGIPVILLTLRDGKHDPLYTKLYGIVGFLKKPFDSETLMTAIKEHIHTNNLTKDETQTMAAKLAEEMTPQEEDWDQPPKNFVVRVEETHEEPAEAEFETAFKEADDRHITIRLPVKDDLTEGEDIKTVEPLEDDITEEEIATVEAIDEEFVAGENIETDETVFDEVDEDLYVDTASVDDVLEGEDLIETVDVFEDDLAEVEDIESVEPVDEEFTAGETFEAAETIEEDLDEERHPGTEEINEEGPFSRETFPYEEASLPEPEEDLTTAEHEKPAEEESFVIERSSYLTDTNEVDVAGEDSPEWQENITGMLTKEPHPERPETAEAEPEDLSVHEEAFDEETVVDYDVENELREENSLDISKEEDVLDHDVDNEKQAVGNTAEELSSTPEPEEILVEPEGLKQESIVSYANKPKKRSPKLLPVLLVFLLGIAAAGGYYFMKTGGDIPWEVPSTVRNILQDIPSKVNDILSSSEEQETLPVPDIRIEDAAEEIPVSEDIDEAKQEPLPEERPDEPVIAEESPPETVAQVAEQPPPPPPPAVQKPKIAAPKADGYYVQFGIFKGKDNANKLVLSLSVKGLDSFVKEGRFQSGAFAYRVLLKKRYSSVESAKKEALRIKATKNIGTTVYRVEWSG